MKRIMFVLPILAVCTLFSACGGGENVTAKTDPVGLKSEKVEKEGWENAFASQENYCMHAVIKASEGENEGTMSETVIDFCNDGERAFAKMTAKGGEESTFEMQSYADLKEGTVWSRTDDGDKWTEWDAETYTSEQFAEFFAPFRAPDFARGQYADFSYSESENGYTMSATALSNSPNGVDEYIASLLAGTPADLGDVTAEKAVLKFKDGKPCAFLFEATSPEESEDAMREREDPTLFDRFPAFEVGLSRHGRMPRILIRIRPIPRTPLPKEAEVPQKPALHISSTQLFYNYGKARVTLPSDRPPLGEE